MASYQQLQTINRQQAAKQSPSHKWLNKCPRILTTRWGSAALWQRIQQVCKERERESPVMKSVEKGDNDQFSCDTNNSRLQSVEKKKCNLRWPCRSQVAMNMRHFTWLKRSIEASVHLFHWIALSSCKDRTFTRCCLLIIWVKLFFNVKLVDCFSLCFLSRSASAGDVFTDKWKRMLTWGVNQVNPESKFGHFNASVHSMSLTCSSHRSITPDERMKKTEYISEDFIWRRVRDDKKDRVTECIKVEVMVRHVHQSLKVVASNITIWPHHPHRTTNWSTMLLSTLLFSGLCIFSPFVLISCVSIHHRNDQSNNAFHFHPHASYETPQSLTRRMAYGLLVANPAPMQIAALPAGFMHQNYL